MWLNNKKIIGTLVPLSALSSLKVDQKDQGTFAVGEPFLDWLQKTKQTAWQLLPLHETQLEQGSMTKHIPSPYKSYGIGLDPTYLPTAFAKREPTQEQKQTFIKTHQSWIMDYALFCALRDHFGTDDWRDWEEGIRTYQEDAVDSWTDKLQSQIDHYIIVQWQLHEAYHTLKQTAKDKNISLIGDLLFYPSIYSPLVWAHQDVFQLGKDGEMHYVSGIPNVHGTFFGRQVWGHPLYNWEKEKEKVIEFWKMRLLYQAELFDMLRFDHARGFFVYGMMDVSNEQNDREVPGPGAMVLKELLDFSQQIGLSIFAEDDDNPSEVKDALLKFQIAGVRVFRFALDEKKDHIIEGYAAISHYPELTVAYSTTHDTETLLGYLQLLSVTQKETLGRVAHLPWSSDNKEFALSIRNALLQSPAQIVIIPIQDWLLLIDRINIPGTEKEIDDPNWRFTLKLPIEELSTNFPDLIGGWNTINR